MKNTKMQKSNLPKQSITIDGMELYELCRWAALKDAVDIVGDKCDEKKINFADFDLKPLDLLKYVDVATDTLYHKVSQYEKN
jgi:hypothetical protein